MYYSKNTPLHHGEQIIIPENYSGNAFRENISLQTDENDKEVSNIQELPSSESENEAVPTMKDCKEEKTQKNSLLSFLLPPKSNGIGGLLHNIDTEDIIILVLLFLMYQSDTDDDISLLLLLLLFLK